jgi:hypothetical protein
MNDDPEKHVEGLIRDDQRFKLCEIAETVSIEKNTSSKHL